MPKSDVVLPQPCPRCSRHLIYIKSTASIHNGKPDTHFYSCPVHGAWKILPTGRIEPYSFTH